MSKRVYDGGSLQGFNVVSQLYPSSAGCRGFCGGGSVDTLSYSYGLGAFIASVAGGARWYEILWRSSDSAGSRGSEGRGFYEGVVCRGCIGIPEEVADGVIGYVGIGVDINSECDGLIVDRVLMEWRTMVGALNGMTR